MRIQKFFRVLLGAFFVCSLLNGVVLIAADSGRTSPVLPAPHYLDEESDEEPAALLRVAEGLARTDALPLERLERNQNELIYAGPGIDWSTQEGALGWADGQIRLREQEQLRIVQEREIAAREVFRNNNFWTGGMRLWFHDTVTKPVLDFGKNVVCGAYNRTSQGASLAWHVGKYPITASFLAGIVIVAAPKRVERYADTLLLSALGGGALMGAVCGYSDYCAVWNGKKAVAEIAHNNDRLTVMAAGLAHVDRERRTLQNTRDRINQFLAQQRDLQETVTRLVRQAQEGEQRSHAIQQEVRENTTQLDQVNSSLARNRQMVIESNEYLRRVGAEISTNRAELRRTLDELNSTQATLKVLEGMLAAQQVATIPTICAYLTQLKMQLLTLKILMDSNTVSAAINLPAYQELLRETATIRELFGRIIAMIRLQWVNHPQIVASLRQLFGGEAGSKPLEDLVHNFSQDLPLNPRALHCPLPADLFPHQEPAMAAAAAEAEEPREEVVQVAAVEEQVVPGQEPPVERTSATLGLVERFRTIPSLINFFWTKSSKPVSR